MSIRERIAEIDEGAMLFDGFDDAIIGVFERCGQPVVVAYDYEKCVQALVSQGLTEEEAEEHMSFNVEGGWLGDRTPAVVRRLHAEENQTKR